MGFFFLIFFAFGHVESLLTIVVALVSLPVFELGCLFEPRIFLSSLKKDLKVKGFSSVFLKKIPGRESCGLDE